MTKRKVKPRYTNFGNGPISDYHRHKFGYDMPAVDIDALLVEYESAAPAAVIDYKHYNFGANGERLDPFSASYRALRELCAPRVHEIPLFVVKYAHDLTSFMVYPMNMSGRDAISGKYAVMNETEFRSFHERLREAQKQRRAS